MLPSMAQYAALVGATASEYRTLVRKKKKLDTVTTFQSEFSPDGRFLVSCDSQGCVTAYDLDRVQAHIRNEGGLAIARTRRISFVAHKGSIFSLVFITANGGATILVTGGLQDIRCWDWAAIVTSLKDTTNEHLTIEPVGIIRVFPCGDVPVVGETNALCVDKRNPNVLYSGGGDGNVYSWDISRIDSMALLPITTFCGHTEYIHCLSNTSDRIISGSEDSTIRIWDCRSGASTAEINPTGAPKRSKGITLNYVSCVNAISDNWLVCGGGGRVGLRVYHLGSTAESANATQALRAPPQTIAHLNHRLWVGGQSNTIQIFNLDGHVQSELSCSAESVFTLSSPNNTCQSQLRGCVVAGGFSTCMDVYASTSHSAFSLECPVMGCETVDK
eukprot:c17245_g1_i1.p1 GENE.c17245_g1_i1~~c17245_g1_i1.p1  ORF type:complete len:402 (+),score=82.93 c17245_g1_i1:45-1208(+)